MDSGAVERVVGILAVQYEEKERREHAFREDAARAWADILLSCQWQTRLETQGNQNSPLLPGVTAGFDSEHLFFFSGV